MGHSGDSGGYGRGGQYSALQEVDPGPCEAIDKERSGDALRVDGTSLGLAGETLKTWIGIYRKRERTSSILTPASHASVSKGNEKFSRGFLVPCLVL